MTHSASRRIRAWIALALALSTLVVAVVALVLSRDDSLERVTAAGVLRVGYSVEPPFSLVADDGTVVGQSAEAAAEVARALGVRIQWVQTELDRQIPDLLAGRFDVIGAGLFMSPERAARVRFSVPTLRVRPAWLTRAGTSAPTLQGLRDGAHVAVVSGSAAQGRLASLGLAGHLHVVPDVRAGVAGVRRGQYDALAVPWPVGRSLVAESAASLAVWPAADGPPGREVALAFRRSDIALASAADSALSPWLQGEAYRTVLARFGLTADDLPSRPGASRP